MKKTRFKFTAGQIMLIRKTLWQHLKFYKADPVRLQQDDGYLKDHAIYVNCAEMLHTIFQEHTGWHLSAALSVKLSPGQVAVLCWAISDVWVFLGNNDERQEARQVLAIIHPKMVY